MKSVWKRGKSKTNRYMPLMNTPSNSTNEKKSEARFKVRQSEPIRLLALEMTPGSDSLEAG